MAKKLKWKKLGSHNGVVVSSKTHKDGHMIFKIVHPTGNTFILENNKDWHDLPKRLHDDIDLAIIHFGLSSFNR